MKTIVNSVQDLDTAIAESIVYADVTGCDWASIQMDLYEDSAVSTYNVMVSNNAQKWYAAKYLSVDPTTGTLTSSSVTISSGNTMTRMIPVTDVRYIGVQAPSGSGGTYKVTIRAASAN